MNCEQMMWMHRQMMGGGMMNCEQMMWMHRQMMGGWM